MSNRSSQKQLEIGELSEMLAAGAESFCRHYFPLGQKQGNYWQMGDTSGSKGKSLVVRLQNSGGRKAGQWTDYATSEFGDLIDLLHIHLGDPNPSTTFKEVRAYLGETPSPAKIVETQSPAIQANKRREQARTIIKYSKSTYRTLASNYLFGRKIKRFGPSLRFHPSLYVRNEEDTEFIKRPALVAKITDNEGVITGCSRTFLDPASNQLADMESPKRVLGDLFGNAIRFDGKSQEGSIATDEDLIVGEGLENVLSVGTAIPEFDLASCLTANHLSAFIPPINIKRLWIARDNDDAGEGAAMRLRERLAPAGLWCGDLIPNKGDFNEDLIDLGVDKLRDRLLTTIKRS